jgi:hypothetical protein
VVESRFMLYEPRLSEEEWMRIRDGGAVTCAEHALVEEFHVAQKTRGLRKFVEERLGHPWIRKVSVTQSG